VDDAHVIANNEHFWTFSNKLAVKSVLPKRNERYRGAYICQAPLNKLRHCLRIVWNINLQETTHEDGIKTMKLQQIKLKRHWGDQHYRISARPS
jgi:hypothetical protein